MAEIMRLLGDRGIGRAAVERQPAAGDVHQPGDHAQQRGFAGAVAPGHHQRFAAGQAEIEAGKDLAPAPAAGQIVALKLHQARFSLPAAGGKAVPAAENPDIPAHFCEVPSLIWRPRAKRPYKPAVTALT